MFGVIFSGGIICSLFLFHLVLPAVIQCLENVPVSLAGLDSTVMRLVLPASMANPVSRSAAAKMVQTVTV